MIRKLVLSALLASGISAAVSAPAAAQGIPSIAGKWSEDRTGEPIVITRTGFGWETWLAWAGQTTITPSGGYRGSHVKLEGMDVRCFYYINVNQNDAHSRKMTWALRAGSERCPQSGVYSGVLY